MTIEQASAPNGLSTDRESDAGSRAEVSNERNQRATLHAPSQPTLGTRAPASLESQIETAIGLGWRVVQLDTELYRLKTKPAPDIASIQRPIALPGRGSLTARRHLLLRTEQLSSFLASLEGFVPIASLRTIEGYLQPLREIGTEDGNSELSQEERNTVFTTAWRVNEELLIRLQAADSRVGCGYTLGRGLCNLSYNLPDCPPPSSTSTQALALESTDQLPRSTPSFEQILNRLGKIRGWVGELNSLLRPHAGRAVLGGIDHWNDWFLNQKIRADRKRPSGAASTQVSDLSTFDVGRVNTALMVQGPVWLNLLNGQTVPADLLSRDAYEQAGEALIKRYRQLAVSYLHQVWPYLTIFCVLLAGVVGVFVWLGASKTGGANSTSSVVGVLVTLLAGAGITGKTASATLTKTANSVGVSIWQAELDGAIALAAVRLPGGDAPVNPLVTRPSLFRRGDGGEKLHEQAIRLAAARDESAMLGSGD
jgi:hypothetical protein